MLTRAPSSVRRAPCTTLMPRLCARARARTAQVVATLVELGADVERGLPSGLTPLCMASLNGHLPTVRALGAAGADANRGRDDGLSPLILAAEGGDADVVDALIGLGARVDLPTRSGVTALVAASKGGHLGLVRSLAEVHAADVNGVVDGGPTPLGAACYYGHAPIARLLLDRGAAPSAETMSLAAQRGHDAVAELVGAALEAQGRREDGSTSRDGEKSEL